jgi:hypothetical protein
MKHLWLMVAVHCLLQTTVRAAGVNDAFVLIRRQKDIALYERWIAGSNSSPVREIKAVFTVNTGTGNIIALLKDPEKGAGWNKNALDFKIWAIDHANWITYVCYHIPWPFNNQDMCLHYFIKPAAPQDRHIEITFESVADIHFPIRKDVTRTTGTQGRWLLETQSGGGVQVTYQVTTDKSAKIPRWVSDPLVHNHLFETMNAFKSLLEKQ